jgi:hypothetical protein
VAAINAATAKTTTDLAKAMGALPGATKPAEEGIRGTANAFKDFKRDQVQEGRMVGFYVRELTSFTGASSSTQAALGGLTQGMIGLFTATGPLLYAWAGFEIVKAIAGYFSDASDAIDKAGKAALDSALKMQSAIAGLRQAVGGGNQLSASGAAFGEMNRLRTSAESWDAEAGSATGGDAILARNTAKGLWKAFGDKGGQAEMERLAVEMARENVEAANAEEKKGIAESLANWKTAFAERTKADLEAAKEAERLRRAAMPVFGPGNDLGAARFKMAEEDMKGQFQDVAGPGNDLGAARFKMDEDAIKDQLDLANQLRSMWASIGSTMAGAFNALGDAAGGAMGKVLKIIGQLVAGAVSLAIAMSAAMPPPWGAISMAAMAVGLVATIASTIAQVPSFEVGTSYVPRTGLAMIHQGEAIIPAGENRGRGVTVNLSISALDGQSVYRALTSSRSDLSRVIREAVRDGVM